MNNDCVPLVDENTVRDGAGIPYKIVRVEVAIDIHDPSLQVELDYSGAGVGLVKGDTYLTPFIGWTDEDGGIYTDEDLIDKFGFVLSEYRETSIVDGLPDRKDGE